jgi:hypothetical protein
MAEWHFGEMAEWQNGGMAEWQNGRMGMAHRWNAHQWNGTLMEWHNGMAFSGKAYCHSPYNAHPLIKNS